MDDWTRAAFERLLKLAQSDTHQSRRAANFLLAWWNADSLGAFDPADLFGVDSAIAADMAPSSPGLLLRTTPYTRPSTVPRSKS